MLMGTHHVIESKSHLLNNPFRVIGPVPAAESPPPAILLAGKSVKAMLI